MQYRSQSVTGALATLLTCAALPARTAHHLPEEHLRNEPVSHVQAHTASQRLASAPDLTLSNSARTPFSFSPATLRHLDAPEAIPTEFRALGPLLASEVDFEKIAAYCANLPDLRGLDRMNATKRALEQFTKCPDFLELSSELQQALRSAVARGELALLWPESLAASTKKASLRGVSHDGIFEPLNFTFPISKIIPERIHAQTQPSQTLAPGSTSLGLAALVLAALCALKATRSRRDFK